MARAPQTTVASGIPPTLNASTTVVPIERTAGVDESDFVGMGGKR
jgi:hypothetical protein